MHTALRLLVLPLLAFALYASSSGIEATSTSGYARIEQSVRAALRTDGSVAVIVSLVEPAVAAGGPVDIEALRGEIAAAQTDVLAEATGFTLGRRYRAVPALAGRVDAGGLARLAADPNVATVSLDRPVRATLAESVVQVHANVAHNHGITGEGRSVAVLDTGIDTNHSDLADDLLSEACFLASEACHNAEATDSGPGSAEDDHGHGSHVSGIITSAGVIASKGVAFDAGIHAYKILDESGSGVTSDIIAAMDDVIATYPDTDAINMSLSDGVAYEAGTCDDDIPGLTAAVATLRAGGTVVVAAAGNDGKKDGTAYPACISTIVSTGAVYDAALGMRTFNACSETSESADQVTCFSNSDTSLRMLAPGCATLSSTPGNTTANLCGTSMAAPHVAAAVALLRDYDETMTADAVESCLETTGVPITDPANGVTAPRLDIVGALNCAGLELSVGGRAELPTAAPFVAGGGPRPLALAALAAAALLSAGWLVRARVRRT